MDGPSNHRRSSCQNPRGDTHFCRFHYMHRGKIVQILLAHDLPKEILKAIIMFCSNTKVKVCSPGGHIDFFDTVASIREGDTLVLYLFKTSLDYVLQTSIDLIEGNDLTLKKARRKRYPAETIMDTDYADDITLLANTPTQAESLLQSLEQSVEGINSNVNSDKAKYMCFNQEGNISTLSIGNRSQRH